MISKQQDMQQTSHMNCMSVCNFYEQYISPARHELTGHNIHMAIVTSAEEGGYVFGAVCLSVCLSVRLLANLWTDFDEIFWRGRAWLKDQEIQFWWRSADPDHASDPGVQSPKSGSSRSAEVCSLWVHSCSSSTVLTADTNLKTVLDWRSRSDRPS